MEKKAIKDKVVVVDTDNHHTLIAGKFPIKLWERWKAQCKTQFNDIYWHKIWTDHLKAQAYDILIGSAVQTETVPKDDKKEEDIPLIGDGGK